MFFIFLSSAFKHWAKLLWIKSKSNFMQIGKSNGTEPENIASSKAWVIDTLRLDDSIHCITGSTKSAWHLTKKSGTEDLCMFCISNRIISAYYVVVLLWPNHKPDGDHFHHAKSVFLSLINRLWGSWDKFLISDNASDKAGIFPEQPLRAWNMQTLTESET